MTHSTHPTSSPWRIVGAKALGTSHVKTNQSCQDAFAYHSLPHALIISVSDGAGSAAKAEVGANVLARVSVNFLIEHLAAGTPNTEAIWQETIQQTFQAARTALEAQADSDLRDYAATLMVVVVTDQWTVGGLVGDSVAVVMNEAEEMTVLCTPQKGEYANTTNFLSQPNILAVLEVQARPERSMGVAVFSDGLHSLAVNLAQNKPHVPFFKPLFAFVAAIDDQLAADEQLTLFLNSERVNARTDDDKTLVLARRRELTALESEPTI